ncbi:MAG TPA: hypothetical protein VN620_07505 [Candidatus Methylomirabilis sp.]|nr:hypothetical protein [Candidatus Methylomirabilis sp.]
MNSGSRWTSSGVAAVVGMLCIAFAASMSAQVQSQTATTSGAPTKEVKIETGEVVAVKGNDLFVKMPDGTIRDFPNIPGNAMATVGGKKLGIHELKPGMKLQRTTVTTTTPQVVTTIETVTGKVWHVNPPVSVILTLENGQNQMFKIPEGQKFTVDGQETDAWGLKDGMKVTATKITTAEASSVTQKTQVTGTMPPDVPVLIATGAPTPVPTASATAGNAGGATATGTAAATQTTTTEPEQSQATVSRWPLFVGLLAVIAILAWLGNRFLRKNHAQTSAKR